jgi:tetratricopeptide (TPR) repeat protein
MAKNQKQNATQLDEALTRSEAFFVKYQKPLIYGVVAVIVIIAGAILYHTQIAVPRGEKASEALFRGEQYFANGDYQKAIFGDGQGYDGFEKIADQYSSTKAGNLAKMYAGLSCAQMGKWGDAVKYLESYKDCGDAMVSPAALSTLGNCYAHLNQLDKATDMLVKAAKKADNNSLSPVYLIQAGEIYESQGKNDKALECYKEIKSKYFQSMQYQEIDKYIERASK